MVSQVGRVTKATALYDTQKVYGDRLKSYKQENPPVLQMQTDAITISTVAAQSLAVHRKVKDERRPIAYSNPRTDNVRASFKSR